MVTQLAQFYFEVACGIASVHVLERSLVVLYALIC